MAGRLRPILDPVTFELDGEPIEGERGEPLAFALIAADRLALARSPKFHRPRGPSCLRGACDGCLVRVDGEPNVATCLLPCRGGERLETQNVLGTRELDLLRVTDWFFPHGFDHHHLLAGVPGSSAVLTPIARRLAGLGTLPEPPSPASSEAAREPAQPTASGPSPAPPLLSDEAGLEPAVAIVGGGLAGLLVAEHLAAERSAERAERAERRRPIALFENGPVAGGSLRARDPARALDLASRAVRAGAHVHPRTTVAGIYGRELLVVGPFGARIVRPRIVVLATGAHDGVAVFEGNDLPGVFSARAAALLALAGIAVGRRLCLVGDGPYLDVLRRELAGRADVVANTGLADPPAVQGGLRVRGVVVGGTRHRVDAVVVEAPFAPAFELCAQAGGQVRFDAERGGYVPCTDTAGRAAEGIYCAGEAAGTGPSLEAIAEQARRVAGSVRAALQAG